MSKLLLEISRLRDRTIQEIPRLRQQLEDFEEFVANEDLTSIDPDCNAVISLRKLLRVESKGADESRIVDFSDPANDHLASSSVLVKPLSLPALDTELTNQLKRIVSGFSMVLKTRNLMIQNTRMFDPTRITSEGYSIRRMEKVNRVFISRVRHSIKSPLIIQAFRCTEENPSTYYTMVSEDRIFSRMPMLRVLFEGKKGGSVKDDDDKICHDPRISSKLKIKVPGKIIFMHEVIKSGFHDMNMNHGTIAKWPVKKLWLYSSCLVNFWDTKKLSSAISTEADLENIQILADFLLVSKPDRELMHKQLSFYIKKRKDTSAAPCGQASDNNQRNVSVKREPPYEAETNHKKARYEIIDLTSDDDLRKQKPRAGKRGDIYVPGGNAVLHDPDREEPSDWREDTATEPSRRTDDHMDKRILIQSLTASGDYEHCLQEVRWVTEESSVFSDLIKGCTTPAEPGLESMVNLHDWHEGNICVSVNWNSIVRHYAAKSNQEAAMIQGWGVEMAFKALGPWLERVGKNSEDWVEWEPEVIEKACIVEKFIGANDRRCGARSLV